jgi:arabinogalactan endo-1,4-beta-galactosidase
MCKEPALITAREMAWASFRIRDVLAWAIVLAVLAARPSLAAETSAKFLLGADVSALGPPGRSGGWGAKRIYQENGQTNEEWSILLNHGWTIFRLRVFVSPVRNAPNNSLESMLPLAKRIKAAGASILLCLHLSDTWADPQHQEIPVAWRNLDFDGLLGDVEAHTHNVVKQLKEAGAMPDWVQVGNEITGGTLWPLGKLKPHLSTPSNTAEADEEATQWDRLTRILKAGIRGVKSAAGDTPPRIAIHIDKGGSWAATEWFFDHLNAAHVEYDIIAHSFYPTWAHGTLEQLWENMNQCARRYNKDFAVVETGYDRTHIENNPFMKWRRRPKDGRSIWPTSSIPSKRPHAV